MRWPKRSKTPVSRAPTSPPSASRTSARRRCFGNVRRPGACARAEAASLLRHRRLVSRLSSEWRECRRTACDRRDECRTNTVDESRAPRLGCRDVPARARGLCAPAAQRAERCQSCGDARIAGVAPLRRSSCSRGASNRAAAFRWSRPSPGWARLTAAPRPRGLSLASPAARRRLTWRAPRPRRLRPRWTTKRTPDAVSERLFRDIGRAADGARVHGTRGQPCSPGVGVGLFRTPAAAAGLSKLDRTFSPAWRKSGRTQIRARWEEAVSRARSKETG